MDELEQINAKIAELNKEIDSLKARAAVLAKEKVDAARKEIEALMKTHGLRPEDLKIVERTKEASKKPVAVKYKKGEQTWTGRGRQPGWIAEHINGGGSLQELAVA